MINGMSPIVEAKLAVVEDWLVERRGAEQRGLHNAGPIQAPPLVSLPPD